MKAGRFTTLFPDAQDKLDSGNSGSSSGESARRANVAERRNCEWLLTSVAPSPEIQIPCVPFEHMSMSNCNTTLLFGLGERTLV